MTASEVIEFLKLKPLPMEGGYYRETHRSEDILSKGVLKGDFEQDKAFYTAIYYLLTPESLSALHLLPIDEIFHFYLGDPVEMLNLFDDGSSKIITLGQDLWKGHQVQYKVPRNTWQGSQLASGGSFALMGTTMAPGFDFSDYQSADALNLVEKFPSRKKWIAALT